MIEDEINDELTDLDGLSMIDTNNRKNIAANFKQAFDKYVKYLLTDTMSSIKQEKDIIYEDSPVLKSTAPGFWIEAKLKYYIKLSCFNKWLVPSNEALSGSDFIFDFQNIIIHLNLKAVKNNKCNSGIVALNNALKFYNSKKPILYMVYYICWKVDLDSCSIQLYSDESFKSYYLDSFILNDALKTDNRSWSLEKKKISGRIQCPIDKENLNIENILNWDIFREQLKLKFPKLKQTKSKQSIINDIKKLYPDFKLIAKNGKEYSISSSKFNITDIQTVAEDFGITIYEYNYT